jgi:hypothetical protein
MAFFMGVPIGLVHGTQLIGYHRKVCTFAMMADESSHPA